MQIDEIDITDRERSLDLLHAKRPARVVLDCRLYQLVTGHSLPDWKQAVVDYCIASGE